MNKKSLFLRVNTVIIREEEEFIDGGDRLFKYPPCFEEAEKHYNATRIAQNIYTENLDEHDVCNCCGRMVKKCPLALSTNIRQLHFLGSGYVLYFIFIKHAIYMLLALFLGTGLFDILTNLMGDYCTPLELELYGDSAD